MRREPLAGGQPDGIVAHLEKIYFSYGSRPILKNLDLALMAGETVVVSGSNGSGKTTLIKILAGLLRPVQGSLKLGRNFFGRNLYLPGGGLYEDLSVGENLKLFAGFHQTSRERLEALISHFALGDLVSRRPTELSRGQAARSALAQHFLPEVSLYLLDEPFSGLDNEASLLLTGYAEQCRKRGAALLISSTGSDGALATGAKRYHLLNGSLSVG